MGRILGELDFVMRGDGLHVSCGMVMLTLFSRGMIKAGTAAGIVLPLMPVFGSEPVTIPNTVSQCGVVPLITILRPA